MIKVNEFFEIKDSETLELIASGRVTSTKDCFMQDNEIVYNPDKIYYISNDYKYFFNFYSKRFIINKSEKELDNYYNIEKLSNYESCHLTDNCWTKPNLMDIIIDNNINELDKEVKNLVLALNKLDGCTTDGSCCGHNKSYLWVSCQFNSITPIILLRRIIFSKFNNKFRITSLRNRSQASSTTVGLAIESYEIGEPAYKEADKLAKYLSLILK